VLSAPSDNGQGQVWFAMERQRTIVSLRATYPLGPVQLRGYLERHDIPAGQTTNPDSGETQALPRDSGWVIGAQASGGVGGLSAMLVVKYARGLGAFGDLTVPYGFSLDRSVTSAHLTLVAAGVTYEHSRFALPLAAYFASFRDASGLDVNGRNYEEFVVDARPTVYAHDIFHIALDVSYQLRAPHTLTTDGSRPLRSGVFQVGIMPMIVPGGTGFWTRPAIRIIYAVRLLSQDARNDLFAAEDPRNARAVSQFIGAGVEWWFNSSYR
jgi:maltoporin